MSDEERTWARVSGIGGVATVLGYLTVLFAPLPWPFRRLIFFAIAPGGIVFVLGLGRLLKMRRRSISA
jgi:hypothetical protein